MRTITVELEDLIKINGGRQRKFKGIDSPLSAQVILEDIQKHNRKRVIVICNTVSQSQGLFKDLKNAIQTGQFVNDNLELKLLHSRFLPKDRQDKEKDLETVFAKDCKDDDKCHILIATQVIEVGLNITCEVMHSQLCPMSSLLQRAGRCARFNNEQGEFYIYREVYISPENSLKAQQETEDTEAEKRENKRNFLPYENKVCEDTWIILQKHDFNQPVDFTIETQWINEVHTKEIEVQTKRRQNNRGEFEQQFENAIFRGDRSASRDLIRLVNNRNIFVTDKDNLSYIDSISSDKEINLDKLQPFSVPLTSLLKAYRDFQDAGHQTWLFKRIENPSEKDKESYKLPILSEITSSSQIISSIRILVNPEFIFYSQDIGLWININPDEDEQKYRYQSLKKENQSSFDQYSYHMDTYLGHLVLMWEYWGENFPNKRVIKRMKKADPDREIDIFCSVREELLEAGGRFIQKYIFENATQKQAEALFDILVFLAIITHDLGKLQTKWQSVMKGWQEIAYQEFREYKYKFKNPSNHLLAHTDYQPSDSTIKKRYDEYMKKHRRPPHAIESAFLSWEILDFCLVPFLENNYDADKAQTDKIMDVVMMASGRHHSAWTKGWELKEVSELEKIELHKNAPAEIYKSWRVLSKSLLKLLPDLIDFPTEPNFLQNLSYPVEICRLNCFESDDLEYQQLYSLLVRALRLCDMRSVQRGKGNEKNKHSAL